MLYRNDEIYTLTQGQKDQVKKYFHNKFPVKVVYPPERIIKSRLKHNILPDKPNSISFDLKALLKTENGTEVWRYAENVIVDSKGNKKYIPKKFRFNGTRFLDVNEMELIFFLLRKSQYCLGGQNQGRAVKFVFEDLVTEAEKKAAKRELESRIGTLLYSKEFGLKEEKLRAVAKAYFVRNVDDISLPEVKNILDMKIHASKGGPDKFFEMVNEESETKSRIAIQNAIDYGLIKYEDKKKAWVWLTSDEKGFVIICKVPPNKIPNESLYDYYKGDESFRDDLDAAITARKPKPVREKVQVGDDDEIDKEE